ncbi:MAG: hypothetical protein RJA59_1008, partial [Pseudomonadota bacterium]
AEKNATKEWKPDAPEKQPDKVQARLKFGAPAEKPAAAPAPAPAGPKPLAPRRNINGAPHYWDGKTWIKETP